MVATRSVVWVDAGAGSTITRINASSTAATIQTELLTCMEADFQQWWEGLLAVNTAPSPVAAQYQSVSQRATLVFTTTDPGQLVQLTIVAPKLSIFLSDGRTVDLSNSDIVNLATACVGQLCTVSGATATALIAGYLGS